MNEAPQGCNKAFCISSAAWRRVHFSSREDRRSSGKPSRRVVTSGRRFCLSCRTTSRPFSAQPVQANEVSNDSGCPAGRQPSRADAASGGSDASGRWLTDGAMPAPWCSGRRRQGRCRGVISTRGMFCIPAVVPILPESFIRSFAAEVGARRGSTSIAVSGPTSSAQFTT